MFKKSSVGLLSVALLLGCASNSNYVVNDDYVEINGHKIERDETGSLVVNSEQLELLKGKDGIVVLDSVLPSGGVAVTEEELHLLSKDKQLLEETIENVVVNEDVFTFLIKKGSLKENLDRLAVKYTTDEEPLSLDYQDLDYYVPSSKIVRADSLEELIAETLSVFPVFTSIEGVTFFLRKGSLKGNLKRLSEKFSTDEEPLSLDYSGGDLYVPSSQLVRAESIDELVASILAPYPVFASIE